MVHESKMTIRRHLLAGLFLTSTVIQLSLAQHQHQQQQHPLSPNRHDASSSRDPFTSDFSAFAKQAMIDWHVAGLAISVVDGNQTYGYGYSTLPDTPATPETLWYVGSTTKAFTAATIATLIDSGNYSSLSQGWKTKISSLIRDDFVLQDSWATEHITLEDAASHRTGMPRHDSSVRWNPNDPRGIVKETVRNLRNLPMNVEPRTVFQYCNMFFTVLGHVAETLTGQWLGDVMKDLIWAPLGMNSTYFEFSDAIEAGEDVSEGYIWHADKQELKSLPHIENSVMNGAGAIISNVVDYSKWVKCLLDRSSPFSEAVHREMRFPRMVPAFKTIGSDVTSYSLGWFQATVYGKTVYWHSGSTLTHGALVYWFPNDDYGITIFVNTVSPIRQILLYRLIEERFGIPHAEQKLRSNITNVLFPSRPKTPLPPTLSLQEHAGTYEDVGYGQFTFTVGTHPASPDKTTLVAERMDRAWNETVRMEHVSGDYWIWHTYIAGGPTEAVAAFKTEFKIGTDGTVSGLEVVNLELEEGVDEGAISYKKLD
ncbi:beta-lactamase domain-containing protein [Sarocladium implicatum]|nr:beta-lactamase domain-containing protein [Sarocladium implicatum]